MQDADYYRDGVHYNMVLRKFTNPTNKKMMSKEWLIKEHRRGDEWTYTVYVRLYDSDNNRIYSFDVDQIEGFAISPGSVAISTVHGHVFSTVLTPILSFRISALQKNIRTK